MVNFILLMLMTVLSAIENFESYKKNADTVKLDKKIEHDLLADHRNGSRCRDGLRISVFETDLCTVEESSICGHGIDLHCTIHLGDHIDDDMHVIIQTANLPLKLTKNQYRTVLAMILEIFRKTLASVLLRFRGVQSVEALIFPFRPVVKHGAT